MRHFKLYLNLLLLMAIGMATSCSDDFDRPPMTIPSAAHINKVNTTILELKSKYWKNDKNYIDTIKLTEAGDSMVIKGRVVSSDAAGNIYKNLVIQDETAAITISINGNSLYTTYRIGQEVVIPVTDLFIGKYNTLQQLGYPDYSDTYGWQATFLPLALFQSRVELNGLPDASKIDTLTVKLSELPTTPAGLQQMQSQLVRINDVSFVEADGKTTFSESDASTSRNLKDEEGNTIVVRNSNYANFKSDILPLGKGSVVGILSYYSGAWQLLLRDVDDCIGFDTTIKGSKSDPYTVAEAIEKQGAEKAAWVSGYIVGAVAPEVTEVKSNDDIEFTAPTVLDNTLVIAESADVKDYTKCIVLELPQGSQLRAAANLKDVAHKELLGTKITLKGKFASCMGTYGLIGNSGGYDEFFLGEGGGSTEAQGDGTEANPYNVAGVIDYINTLGADTESDKAVYIKGIVSANNTTESTISQYGNMTFDIVDVAGGTKSFKAFQVYGPGNNKFTSVDQIKVGDQVVIYGKVVNYKGNTPETVGKGQAYVVSINGNGGSDQPGGGDQPGGVATGDGTEANPYNVAGVIDYINTLGADTESDKAVYIKGIVSANNTTESTISQYGNMTFDIVDVAGGTKSFKAFQVYGPGNNKFTSVDQIKVGDQVVIYGKVVNYKGNTPETVGKGQAYVVSISGNGGGDQPGGGDEPGGGEIGENALQVVFSSFGLANGTALETLTLADGTTLTFSAGGNSNGPKYYNAGTNVRMYPKNNMKITASKKIESIILNCDEYQGVICNASGDISSTPGSVNVNSKVVTVSGINATEATITNTSASTGTASQIRVISMIINYAE